MTTTALRLRRQLVRELQKAGAIRSRLVRQAFAAVPREDYIPGVVEKEGLPAVYADRHHVTLRDRRGQAISSSSQPSLMAEMLEQLQLARGQRVLEIGAGTGYNAALLAQCVGGAGSVLTVDVDPAVAGSARNRLRGAANVTVRTGDGMLGSPESAPFDRITVTAQPPRISQAWLDQLIEGGLLQVPMVIPGALSTSRVVTFRRVGAELHSISSTPGGFMPFRDERLRRPPDESPGYFGTHGRRQSGTWSITVLGPSIDRLSEASRRRLLGSLDSARRQKLAAGPGLLTHLTYTLPPSRAVRVNGHLDGSTFTGIGMLAERGNGLTAIAFDYPSPFLKIGDAVGLLTYGGPSSAESALGAGVRQWRQLGRPAPERYELRVGFGRWPSDSRWRLNRSGAAHLGVALAEPSA